jgi:GNAT superfamily N-acetyltransferase
MVRIDPLGDDATPATLAEVERIFFDASGRTSFASDAERAAFRERWLGRYLSHDRAHAFVARADCGSVAGYLIGCLDDPAATPRFSDLSYFANFVDLTARYPAHLHINLDPAWRGRAIGARLVETFAAHAAVRGAAGVHIVTGAAARNVRFYQRCGFAALRTCAWEGGIVLFMGRVLGAGPSRP